MSSTPGGVLLNPSITLPAKATRFTRSEADWFAWVLTCSRSKSTVVNDSISLMSCAIASRLSPSGNSSSATFILARGERSSWLTSANRRSRSSIICRTRPVIWLNERATLPISSLRTTGTRVEKSPFATASTPLRSHFNGRNRRSCMAYARPMVISSNTIRPISNGLCSLSNCSLSNINE